MRLLSLIFLLFSFNLSAGELPSPPLMLANVYQEGIELKQYWISEKLDGIRAYWDGERLLSRQGNLIHAPSWLIQQLPDETPLDGELWLARGRFERLSSIVRSQTPRDEAWRQVTYRVFDLPALDQTFDLRLQAMQELSADSDWSNVRLVKQFRISTHEELMQRLHNDVAQGAEGLMLHRGDSLYQAGRSSDLLKLKPNEDAEARVIEHLPGKGKYSGMLGSLLVEEEDGNRFRIGTGFSDAERRQPPPVGEIITFKYYGRTARGIPRFASFLRIRRDP